MAMFLVYPGVAAAQVGTPNDQQATPGCTSHRAISPLPVDAEQVAGEIGVLPLVLRVRALAANCAPSSGITLEELSLRQQITKAIMAASLDVDEVIAEIGYEQARIAEVRERLSDAKSNKVNTLTLAGIIIGSGSGAVGNALGLGNPTVRAGLWVQIVGEEGGIVFSILALREQGGKSYLGTAPNMLAALFGRESEISSVYPQDVWSYLNTVPPANPRTHEP